MATSQQTDMKNGPDPTGERTMEVFVARHPVFDADKEVHAYELAFRSDFDTYYSALDQDRAAVDFMAFVNFCELANGKRGLVNFTRNLVMRGFPVLLPKESMTTVLPSDTPADAGILNACSKLRTLGYMLAVSDFSPRHADNPLLEFVEIAKVDFDGLSAADIEKACQILRERNIKPLAMNVQTVAQFDKAVEWGFEFFQGEFFSKPIVRPGKDISANKMTYLRLLNEVNRAELSYDEIEALVKQDVAMTYRLLKFMNSAWFGLKYEIHSIKHALVMLGPQEIKRWVSLLAVRKTAEDKPRELLIRSLTRAKAAEQIAPLVGMGEASSELFLLGMFSVIDALVDKPMAEVLDMLPLNDNIKQALTTGRGKYGPMHCGILAYERGDWEAFSAAAQALGIDEDAIPDIFRKSLRWANQALQEI